MRIALVTASKLPKPDLDSDVLTEALRSLGADPVTVAWTANCVWSGFDLVLLRTPWDYATKPEAFVAWATSTSKVASIANALPVVTWNYHKQYLLDIASREVPVVPTTLLRQRSAFASNLEQFGPAEIVAKPAIGVGAIGAMRGLASSEIMRDHVRAGLETGDMLVQPFVPTIETEGEFSLVYLGGIYSHTVRKRAKAGDFRVQDHHGGAVADCEPLPGMRAIADRVCACSPCPLLYARIDLVLGESGPMLMELEAIEPELFLRRQSHSAIRFAQAILGVAHRPLSGRPSRTPNRSPSS
jgi:glutathione synthase/RimK-type ligase-like ATP-grasp enzyme